MEHQTEECQEKILGDRIDPPAFWHDVISALKRIQILARGQDEFPVQDEIAKAFEEAGLAFAREYRLGRGRVDFMVEGAIAVEVKRSRPDPAKTRAQLARYAGFEEVVGLVLVVDGTTSIRAGKMEGKPFEVVTLDNNWGIAV